MSKYMYKLLTVFIITLGLNGCDKPQPVVENRSALLFFTEYENNVDPYQTRLIVTKSFMRFDDGEGSEDYILFDRHKKIIYSVNTDEQTVMSVSEKHHDIKPPFELKLESKQLALEDNAPQIAGKEARHFRFLANDKACYDVIAVEGLMPQVVTALQEFNHILASDSAMTFNNLPADMQNACDMSMDTFAAGRHLEKGFPIQEWTESGTGRHLVDYNEDYQPDKSLFELPKDFKQYSVQDYREGKVSFDEVPPHGDQSP